MNLRTTIGLTLLLLIVIFIMQNTVVVDIRLLFWKVSLSRSLMIFLVLAIVIGWMTAGHFHRRHDKSRGPET